MFGKKTPGSTFTLEDLKGLTTLDVHPLVAAALSGLQRLATERDAIDAERNALEAGLGAASAGHRRKAIEQLDVLGFKRVDLDEELRKAGLTYEAAVRAAKVDIGDQLRQPYCTALRRFAAAIDRVFDDDGHDLLELEGLVERLALKLGSQGGAVDLLPQLATRVREQWTRLRDAARDAGFD